MYHRTPIILINDFVRKMSATKTNYDNSCQNHYICPHLSFALFNTPVHSPSVVIYWFCIYSYGDFLNIEVTQMCTGLNSLWPGYAIRRHRSVSILACCLTAPTCYLNQCWLIISEVQWLSSEGNLTRVSHPSVTKITSEITKIAFKFLDGQWVRLYALPHNFALSNTYWKHHFEHFNLTVFTQFNSKPLKCVQILLIFI